MSRHTHKTVPNSEFQVIRVVFHPYVCACVTAEKTVLSAYGFTARPSCLSLSLTSWQWMTSWFSNSALPNAQSNRQSTSSSSLMEDQEGEKVGQGQFVFFWVVVRGLRRQDYGPSAAQNWLSFHFLMRS